MIKAIPAVGDYVRIIEQYGGGVGTIVEFTCIGVKIEIPPPKDYQLKHVPIIVIVPLSSLKKIGNESY